MEIDNKSLASHQSSSPGLFKLGMIPDWLDKIFHLSVTPFITFFSAVRINPNWITFAGFLLIVAAGYFLLDGRYYHAVGFIILGGIFDYIDGKVAAMVNRITLFGAIFDSVLDRYSDMIIFLALAVYFYRNDFPLSALIAVLALIGTFMTSYIKAIGKSHGLNFRTGFLRRQERITIICVVLVFSCLGPPLQKWLGQYYESFEKPLPNFIVVAGIWFLAAFANITAFQRLLKLRSLAKDKDISR